MHGAAPVGPARLRADLDAHAAQDALPHAGSGT